MKTVLTRLIQLLIILTPLALFAWLLNQELVPTGVFVVRHSVDEASPFIDRLLPDARVKPITTDTDGDTVQSVIDDPAFFFVHPHRDFETVEMDIWFKNHGVPIVELGGLANPTADAYDLHPLQNTIIDSSDWARLESDGLVLLQRTPTYQSVDDFLFNLPARGSIATYHYGLSEPYRLLGYAPSPVVRTMDLSLRGFHEFKTYVKKETLSFDFGYMDMNRDDGLDPVSVLVLAEDGTPVAEVRAEDDGNVTNDAKPSATKHLAIAVPDLPEGVYKVQMNADRDIFFRTITTSQQKMVFLNNLYLGDQVAWHEPAHPIRLWTESKHLAFTTQHADGVQDVRIGSQTVSVSSPYARTPVEVEADGLTNVDVPKADMIVEGEGHFAFSADQFFNPDPVRLLWNTDLDRLGVDYVIAEYTPPGERDGWTVAHVTFDTTTLVALEHSWKFAFSTPGIRELGVSFDVGRIDLAFRRPPLTKDDLMRGMKRLFGFDD